MRKFARILAAIFCLVVFGALYWLAFHEREPAYKGKRISQYLPTMARAYPYPRVRQLAAETLGEMGPKASAAIPDLILALKDPVKKIRIAAGEALKKIDPAAAAKAGLQ